jgi:hypothetical protein
VIAAEVYGTTAIATRFSKLARRVESLRWPRFIIQSPPAPDDGRGHKSTPMRTLRAAIMCGPLFFAWNGQSLKRVFTSRPGERGVRTRGCK